MLLHPSLNIPTGSNTANLGYQISTRGARQDHQIIYGETRVGGAIVFDAVSGTNNKILHRIIAFAAHEIEEFSTFYFNDEALTLTSATDTNSATYYKPTTATDKTVTRPADTTIMCAFILRMVAQVTAQLIQALIQAGVDWTADHKLQGIAYAYFRLEFNGDAFPNGVPQISCKIKGKKLFDPRDDTTAWSDNPALCVRDYLTNSDYGLGEAAANIDDDQVEIAADVCDYKDYDVNDASPSKTGGKRFTCDGSFTTAVTPHDHLINLLVSMGGLL